MRKSKEKVSEDDDWILEWRELFTKYRSYGSLPADERQRFRELSAKMFEKGILKKPTRKHFEELITGV